MKPIPETVEAVNELDPAERNDGLLEDLTRLANRTQEIVPDLVGVSVAPIADGLTFTLVATSGEIALLDAIQYAAGGPCVDGAHADEVMEFEADVLNEERWRLFAQATAARAVRSTLTLPVRSDEQVVATVNLYAASARAFVGQHQALAGIFGAWAAGAVANADLSFATRREAERAPQRIKEQDLMDLATGIVAVDLGIDLPSARERLQDAANRAGVTAVQLARDIVAARRRRDNAD